MDIKISFCIFNLLILNLLLTKASIVKKNNPQVKYTLINLKYFGLMVIGTQLIPTGTAPCFYLGFTMKGN